MSSQDTSGTAVLNATTNPNPVNTLQNIGDAKIKGVELELTARPSRDLTISLGGGLLDTKVTANPTATFNGSLLNGNELPLAPHYSVNGSIRYAPELDFGTPFAAVDFMYQDSVFFGPDNIATERQQAYGIVNAAVGFKFPDKKLTIELFVRNLFDEEYFVHMTDTSFPGGLAGHVTANWGRPRTFAAQVRYAF